MSSVQLNIQTDHRITIIGGTGDGKTTLGLNIMAHMIQKQPKAKRQQQVILNPGAEDRLYELFGDAQNQIDPAWPDIQHVAALYRKKKDYDKVFWPIVEHGNTLTYIDEVFIVGGANDFGLGLQYQYQAGRRRNNGTIAVSQRPKAIPVFVINMADHLFVGDVMGDDLDHLEKLTNQPWRTAIQNRKQYEFLYWSRHVKEPPVVVKL